MSRDSHVDLRPQTLPEVDPVDRVVIVGVGLIGLPLALQLADAGKDVVALDTDEELVEEINDQSLALDEPELTRLLESDAVQKNMVAQTEPAEGDAFVIAVPTPLEENYRPDLSDIIDAIESIVPALEPGNLINVESTIPPLAMKEIIAPRLEEAGLSPGETIQIAHSPERVLPGNVVEELRHNDRVIGGIDPGSTARAAKIYEPFLEGNIHMTDVKTAAVSKLLENTHRDINIALANEFALIGEELDIDITEVIELANEHPRVSILNPGIGVGGHCLPVDPWFINDVAPDQSDLITTARVINDGMPSLVAKKVRRALSDHSDPQILALGAAYKPDSGDTRNSPALEVVNELRLDGYEIHHYDRHVDGMDYADVREVVSTVNPDVLVQLVQHSETSTQLVDNQMWLNERDIHFLIVDGISVSEKLDIL